MFNANVWWWLHQLRRSLFVRAIGISALSVVTAFVAYFAKYFVPADVALRFGADAVESLLTIIASSMLAVTTFSLSTVVAAHSTAAATATPRATQLLLSDTTAQTMLSTFIGAFVYSLVGIILLKTGIYGPAGRFILFVVTIGVIVLLIFSLLRWIDYLLGFGKLGATMDKVQEAATSAMKNRCRLPYLGAAPLTDIASQISPEAQLVRANDAGYVQHVEIAPLQKLAAKHDIYINLLIQPGSRVHCGNPIAAIDGARQGLELDKTILGSISLGSGRSFYQDPRYGVTVLGEIASRALSPGVNDPGTAISIIGRAVDVLAVWATPPDKEPEIEFENVRMAPVDLASLFDAFFNPVARDGAANAEVQIRLQKALEALAMTGRVEGDGRFCELTLRHSRDALQRAERAIEHEADLERVRAAAAGVETEAGGGIHGAN